VRSDWQILQFVRAAKVASFSSSRFVALRAAPSARTSCQLGSNRVGIKFALPPLLLLASTGARRMESALS